MRRFTQALVLISIALSSLAVADEDTVILKVGEVIVTEADLARYIYERINSGTPERTFASGTGVRQAAEQLLSLKHLGWEARQAGIKSTPQIEWELELQRERLLFRELVSLRVEEEYARVNWSSAAREEYAANPNRFRRGEEVHASHILIDTKKRSDAEAKELAERLLARAKSGEAFDQLALNYSDDPSAKSNGGDLGFFARRAMVKPFSDAAFKLDAQSPLSDLVKTEFGYHIIKFHEKREPGRRGFEEVEQHLINELKTRVPSRIREELTMLARSPVNATVNEEALKRLEQKYRESVSPGGETKD